MINIGFNHNTKANGQEIDDPTKMFFSTGRVRNTAQVKKKK